MTVVMTRGTDQRRHVSKSKLKAKMLEIFRELEEGGGELIVTDRGRPVLRIQPIRNKGTVAEVFGGLQGRVEFLEDPDAPTTVEWSDV